MILFLRAFLLLCLSAFSASVQATSVVFLNPGYSNERFWVTYSQYMQEAAGDLGMRLEVLYGERDTSTILANALAVLKRPQRPDYVLFVNEHSLGPELLRLFSDSGIRLFAVHSTLTEEQQQRVGSSREKYSNWIGSLVPNDEEAGYLMAKELIRQAPAGSQLLAFSGVKNTPSAMQREAGLHQALAEHPQVRLRQLVNGEWSQQRAYEQASALLPRYPQVTLVWAANDEMAFGAMRAAEELGRQLRYTALNNSQSTLQARRDGKFAVLATGHFILGGCAMVMLHDHAAGLDFAERGGKDQMAHLLRLVDAQQAKKLQARLDRAKTGLDFKRFSATRNPAMRAYSCSIDELLR
jgi:ABC-type sugar transport system substrate-binding protein